MSVGQVFSLQILGLQASHYWLNNFHYVVTVDPFNAANGNSLRNQFLINRTENWQLAITNHTFIQRIKVFDVSTPDPHTSTVPGLSGLVNDGFFPASQAYLFKLIPVERNVQVGHKYLSGIPLSWVRKGLVVHSHLSVLNDIAGDFSLSLFSGGVTYTPCVWRRPYPGFPNGRAVRIKRCIYVGLSHKRLRDGNKNDHLLHDFGG